MLHGNLNGKGIQGGRYSGFTSVYSRNEHNIAKQLYSKKICLAN